MSITLPPSAFSNVMNKIDRPVSVAAWRGTPEWEVFKAGYNAAVEQANSRIRELYDIPRAAERVFGD